MIYSKEKQEDIKWRNMFYETARVCGRMFAKWGKKENKDALIYFLQKAKNFDNFIKTGDYTERNKKRQQVDNIINEKM